MSGKWSATSDELQVLGVCAGRHGGTGALKVFGIDEIAAPHFTDTAIGDYQCGLGHSITRPQRFRTKPRCSKARRECAQRIRGNWLASASSNAQTRQVPTRDILGSEATRRERIPKVGGE